MGLPTFVLILVTYGASVSQTPGFTSLRMCEEAKSIAQTGQTLEERAAAQAAEAAKQAAAQREREQWIADHPLHKPQTADEQKAVALARKDGALGDDHVPVNDHIYVVTREGLVREAEPETSWYSLSSPIVFSGNAPTHWNTAGEPSSDPSDVKFARCLQEPDVSQTQNRPPTPARRRRRTSASGSPGPGASPWRR